MITLLTAGIFGWDEEDETGSFIEDLFEGLTEMTAHYSPSVEESTHYPSPRQHKETLLRTEKEARRDKHDPNIPGVSVAPPVDSVPVTHSVIRDEQVFVPSVRREPVTMQPPPALPHRDTHKVLVSALDECPAQTSTTSHEEIDRLQRDQLESTCQEIPSSEDHTLDEYDFARMPTHTLQTQKDNEMYETDIKEKSFDIDTSLDIMTGEELCTHAVDSAEGGGDAPSTTGISSVPQVGSLGSAAVCLLAVWGCACLVMLTKGTCYLRWPIHFLLSAIQFLIIKFLVH